MRATSAAPTYFQAVTHDMPAPTRHGRRGAAPPARPARTAAAAAADAPDAAPQGRSRATSLLGWVHTTTDGGVPSRPGMCRAGNGSWSEGQHFWLEALCAPALPDHRPSRNPRSNLYRGRFGHSTLDRNTVSRLPVGCILEEAELTFSETAHVRTLGESACADCV